MKEKGVHEKAGVLVEFALLAGIVAALAMVFLTDWRTVFSEGWTQIKNLLRRWTKRPLYRGRCLA